MKPKEMLEEIITNLGIILAEKEDTFDDRVLGDRQAQVLLDDMRCLYQLARCLQCSRSIQRRRSWGSWIRNMWPALVEGFARERAEMSYTRTSEDWKEENCEIHWVCWNSFALDGMCALVSRPYLRLLCSAGYDRPVPLDRICDLIHGHIEDRVQYEVSAFPRHKGEVTAVRLRDPSIVG